MTNAVLRAVDTDNAPTVVEINAARGEYTDLVGMLTDLARTTAKDFPPFDLIRLHTEDGLLHGWSSDRSRMAHAVIEVTESLPEPVFLVARDVRQLTSMLRHAVVVTATVDYGAGRVTFTGDGATLALTAHHGGRWPERLPVTDDLPTDSGPASLDPAYVADAAAVAKRRGVPSMRFATAGGMRTTHIRIGPHYRVWVMPRGGEDNVTWLPIAH